jgi:hypothetical protein
MNGMATSAHTHACILPHPLTVVAAKYHRRDPWVAEEALSGPPGLLSNSGELPGWRESSVGIDVSCHKIETARERIHLLDVFGLELKVKFFLNRSGQGYGRDGVPDRHV